MIFILHPGLGWVATLGALLIFVIALLNNALVMRPSKRASDLNLQALSQAGSAFKNAEVVDAMGMTPDVIKRWQTRQDEANTLQRTVNQRNLRLSGSARFVRQLLQVAMLGFGAFYVLQGEMSGGAIIAGTILMSRALQPVEQMISSWRSALMARESYQRLQQLLLAATLDEEAMPLPRPAGDIVL